nr:hypothetical protein [Psychromonas sp. L1A2]
MIKLGVSERLAISCGITGKGPCRSSKTKGINIAISNEFLVRQGLISLKNCGLIFTIHHKMSRMHGGVGAEG